MNRVSLVILLLLLGIGLGSTLSVPTSLAQTNAQVPPEYTQLYSTLQSALNDYSNYLSAIGNSTVHPVTLGAELLPANGNRGTALLTPGALQSVTLYLDRLKELGVGGVTVPIGYPLYTPNFPRYNEYVAFYKQVAQAVRSHGMKLDVESSLLFANSPFSSITFSYSSITWAQFEGERKQMIQTIIQDLKPDYLNMGAEPDTEYKLSGFTEFNSPVDYATYLNYVLNGLDRGSSLLGAGVGTWGNMQYVQQYATGTSLDFIDIHVYPIVGQASLQRVFTIAETAKQHGKKVLMDEVWLYKVATLQSTGIAGDTDVFRLDSFSFFAPLDQQFLGIMTNASRLAGIEYISPFWSTLFFSYVDYDSTTARLPYGDLASLVNKAASQNLVNNQFSSTGEFYRGLAGSGSFLSLTTSTPSAAVNTQTSPPPSEKEQGGLRLLMLASLVIAVAIIAAVIMNKRRK